MAIKKNKCKSGHRLYPTDCATHYDCEGCKMGVCGPAHGCKACDYYLHPECMNYGSTISHETGDLEFCKRRPLGKGEGKKKCCLNYYSSTCDACRLPVKGDFYHSRETDVCLHPLCALPKKEISAVPTADKDHLAVNLLPSKKPECRKAVLSAVPSAVGTAAAKNSNNGSPTLPGLSNKKKKKSDLIKPCLKISRSILAVVVSILIGDPTTVLVNVAVEVLLQLLKN